MFERSGCQSSVFSVDFQGWQGRSKVFDNNLNPEYDETFVFPLGAAGLLPEDKVDIVAQTYKTDGQGRTLGTISESLPLSDLKLKKAVRCTWQLKDVTGSPNGGTFEVKLSATFAPAVKKEVKSRVAQPINMATLPSTPDVYKLRFLVHRCAKLAQAPCSAIVVIRFGGETKSTQICELSQDPEFEEEINFVVNMSQKEIAKENIIIEVLNTLRTDTAAMVGQFKFIVETGFSGEPVGWDEPAYLANDVCRAMCKKWVIVTNPYMRPRNIKGFVNLSFYVLKSGQAVTASPFIDQILMNVSQNVMRPSEVSAQYKKLTFRFFSAEELPMMDVPNGHIPGNKLQRAGFCDPMLSLSFCGIEKMSSIHYATYNPQFNTDIIFNIEIPSITDTMVLRLYDYDTDSVEGAKLIATTHLSLSDISYMSDDAYGFDPTYGPTMMSLYGAPKQAGLNHLLNLNSKGGIGYRGRIMFEVFTKPSYSVGLFAKTAPTPSHAITSSAKNKKAQNCVLVMGIIEATMILPEYGKGNMVKFEASVGEFGFQQSQFSSLSNSLVWPQKPLSDSAKYYFIDYMPEEACIIPMVWEKTLYRLEHLNILQRIRNYFITSLDAIDDEIQKEKVVSEIVYSMKNLARRTMDKVSIELPELPGNANELDKKLKVVREMKMKVIAGECKKLLKGSTLDGSRHAFLLLENVDQTLEFICKEPQIEIPDLTIYMFANDIPVAYFKSPINFYLESSVAKGKDCLRMINAEFRPLDGRDTVAAQLTAFLWFGTEVEYKNSFQFPYDGRISSLAELVRSWFIV